MTQRTWTQTSSADEVAAVQARARRLPIGVVVATSLAAGLLAAIILPFLPVGSVDVNFSTAMVLLGFALGWALLAGLSTRFTYEPQRWAVAPAIFMAVAAAVVLVASDSVVAALGWVWPPALVILVLWVWVHAKRGMRCRARAWLLTPVLITLVLVAAAGTYERIGQASAPAVAMPGHLIDVGPYRLHLQCQGSGGPTVVLEPGAGGNAASMGLIAPAVARETRVCVYDRAGRGWSDPASTAPDGAQIATDLHTLLSRAHVPGPYVLVGHSFGGLYVMTYAAKYPAEVAGLVLVDSTAPNNNPVPAPSAGAYSVSKHVSSLIAATARLGLGRVLAAINYADLPQNYRDDARATTATGKHLAGLVEEYGVATRSAAQAGTLRGLGTKPLVVLTATVGNQAGWMDRQDQMAALSSNSVHRLEPGATHIAFVDDPAHTPSVTRAVHDVVVSVRTKAPLTKP